MLRFDTTEEFRKLLQKNPNLRCKDFTSVIKTSTPPTPEKKSKYRNRRITVNGIKFDSQKEADYCVCLEDRLKCGEIVGYCRQPEFILQDGTGTTVKYYADFIVFYADRTEIIDTKGMLTDVYKLKKKMFNAKYPGLEILEV